MFFASKSELSSDDWELPCPRNECYDDNEVGWTYHGIPGGIKYYLPLSTRHTSPNCWVIVTYRIRDFQVPPCETEDCEIEILNVLVSGDCFYGYVDNSQTPPINYPPIMDMNNSSIVWSKAVTMFLIGADLPCLSPTPGNCKSTLSYKSAACKKIIQNNDDKQIIPCEPFNSCCKQKLTVCRNISGTLHAEWEYQWNDINNCHLNNDSDCNFNCSQYGQGGWIPPKIKLEEFEISKLKTFFTFKDNVLNYEVDNVGYFCTITNLLGNILFSYYIKNEGYIDLVGNNKMIFINISDEASTKTIKLIQE